MVISLKFKNLLTVAILTGVVSFNSFAAENVPHAPEVQNLPTKGEFHVIESAISELKKAFYKLLIGRSLAQVNSYWSRIRFTGRASPPIEKNSASELLAYISVTENAIGYALLSQLSDEVKVVYTLDE
mgnify:CR=1 FL=1